METKTNKGLLVIAHGSKRNEANLELVRLCDKISQRINTYHVQPAYLELASPTISEGFNQLANQGCTDITVLPFFLSHGQHTSVDIPNEIEKKKKDYPDLTITIKEPIGVSNEMADLILNLIHSQSP